MPTTSRSRVIAVLLAAVVLIGGANLAAYAANGKPLLLGKANTENKTATLQNTGSGPALQLKTKPGKPPLKVNRTAKVNKLNADLVDGAHAADLESLVFVYDLTSQASAAAHSISFPALPPGHYLANYTVISSGNPVVCFFDVRDQGLTYSTPSGGFAVNSGAAVLDTTGGTDLLRCVAPAGTASIFSSPAGGLSEVSFTRLDTRDSGTPTVARPTAPRSTGGGPTGG